MPLPSIDVEVSVTVNGSSFPNPSEIHYANDGEIPTCTLVFPPGATARYAIKKKDVVRVFVGLDRIPEFPLFTGHLKDEDGLVEDVMNLSGSLNRAVDDKIFIDDYSNLDNLEISQAIVTVFNQISELSYMFYRVEATNPAVYVPTDFRFEDGESKYGVITQLRDIAIDPQDALEIGRYCIFQHGDGFYFRRTPDPSTAPVSAVLNYSDDVLTFDPETTMRFAYNKARVKGADGIVQTFENAHRIATDGLAEADTVVSDKIPNAGASYEYARQSVINNTVRKAGAEAASHQLLHLIPNFHVVEVVNAPFGFSDKYVLRSLQVDVTNNMFSVSGQLEIPVDVLSNKLSRLLQVRTDSSSGNALQ